MIPATGTIKKNPQGGIVVVPYFGQAADRLRSSRGARESATPKSSLKRAIESILGHGIKRSPKAEADSGTSFPQVTRENTSLKIQANRFRERAKVSAPAENLFDVVLIEQGLGNFNDAYYYDSEALESAVDLFEGAKIYADHPSESEEEDRPERSVRDVLGHYENVHVEDDGGRAILCATVNVLEGERWAIERMKRAVDNADKFPGKEFVGLSINASGDSNPTPIDEVLEKAPEPCKAKLLEAKEQGIDTVKVVQIITYAKSCDLVTEAGAGGKIKNNIEGE